MIAQVAPFKYIVHVMETRNSPMVEMKLDEKTLEGCKSFVLSYFKVDRVEKLGMVRISMPIQGGEQLLWSYPSDGKIFPPDNVTTLRIRPKPAENTWRVVWYKKDSWKPVIVEIKATSWELAALKAVKLEGLNTVLAAQFIAVFLLEYKDISHPNTPTLTRAGELGVRHVTSKPVGTAMGGTASLVKPTIVKEPEVIIPAYTEKKYWALSFEVFKDETKPN